MRPGSDSLRCHHDVGDLEPGPSLEEMGRVAAVLEDVMHWSVDHDVVATSEVRHGRASFRDLQDNIFSVVLAAVASGCQSQLGIGPRRTDQTLPNSDHHPLRVGP